MSLVLVLALCVGCLVACNKGLSTDQLDKLYQEFTKTHKNEAVDSPNSYWVEGSVFYLDDDANEVSANVKWTIEGTTLVTVGTEPNALGQYQIIVPEEVDQDVNYKLIGTLVDDEGKAYTDKDGNEYKLELTKSIAAGNAYKLAISQSNTGKILYVLAELNTADGHYLKTTEQELVAADFYVENVESGKKIYTMVGSDKCYLGVEKSGTYINLVLGGILHNTDAAAYAGSVWTVTDDAISFVLEGKTLYLGNSGTYDTCSVNANNTNHAVLVEAGTAVTPKASIKVASAPNAQVRFTDPDTTETQLTVDAGSAVKFTVTVDTGYELVDVKVDGNPITATNGTYTVTVNGAMEIIVSTKDPSITIDVDSIKFDFSLTSSTSTSAVTDLKSAFTTAAGAANPYLESALGTNVYLNTGSGGAHPTSTGMLKLGKSKTPGQITMAFNGAVSINKVEVKCHDFYAYKEGGTPESKMSINNGTQQDCPYNATGDFETLTFTLDTPTNTITIDTTGRAYILEIIVYLAK